MKTPGRLMLILFLFCAPAFSQDNDFTLFAGVQLPGKITLDNAASTGSTGATQILTDPANVGLFGIRIGHGRVWGGEHTLAYTPNFLDSNSKSLIYNSNLRIQAPLPVVKPYVTAGLGTIISWGSGITDIGTKFAFNYGGGIKLMPAGPVGVQADVRGYVVPRVQDQTLNIAEVSLGVVFGF